MILPPGMPHITRIRKEYDSLWFIIDPKFVSWRHFIASGPTIKKTGDISDLRNLMELYVKENSSIHPDSYAYLRSLAISISTLLNRELCGNKYLGSFKLRVSLVELWEEVAKNPAKDWNIFEMTKRAGMSSSVLYDYCKEIYGVGPMTRVRRIRIESAMAMLISTTRNINDIAQRVGYGTGIAFSKAFKQVVGMTPGEFRKSKSVV